jgi:hypothetical protein
MGSEPRTASRRDSAVALLVAAPAPSVGVLLSMFLVPGPVGNAAYAIGKAVLYGTPAAWRLLVERKRPSFRGCSARAAAAGLAVGLVMAGGILAIGHLAGDRLVDAGRLRAAAEAAGITTPLRFVLLATWLSLVNSLLEEYAFRWFMTERLEAILPRGAVLASAGIFTAHHVLVLLAYAPPPAVAIGSLAVFAAGLAWTELYRRTRSIVPGWISHLLADVAIFAIGYRLLFPA